MKVINDDDLNEEEECKEATLDFVTRKIESVQLTLKGRAQNEQEGKMLWTIEVKEKGKQAYSIERSFSDFQWLVKSLRDQDASVFVPRVGDDGVMSYAYTKLLKDDKHLKVREDGIVRFLRKIQSKKDLCDRQQLQIFLSGERPMFKTDQNLYNQNHHKETSYIERAKGLLPAFITNKEKELLIKIYKEKFADIEDYLQQVLKGFREMHDAHQNFVKALNDFKPEIAAEDEQYGSEVERLVSALQLLVDEIRDISDDAVRDRTRDQSERFKHNFDRELPAYKESLKGDVRHICELLNDLNKRTSESLQKNLHSQLMIEL